MTQGQDPGLPEEPTEPTTPVELNDAETPTMPLGAGTGEPVAAEPPADQPPPPPYGAPQTFDAPPAYDAPPPAYQAPPAYQPPQAYGAPPPAYEPPAYQAPAYQAPAYQAPAYQATGYGAGASPQAPFGVHPVTGIPYSDKSKLVAALLQILIPLGIGRFYIGDNKTGAIQLVVTILTCGIGALWPFIDGIMMLVGDPVDALGRPLRG